MRNIRSLSVREVTISAITLAIALIMVVILATQSAHAENIIIDPASYEVVNHWGVKDLNYENAFDSDESTAWVSNRGKVNPFIAGAAIYAGDGNAFDLTQVDILTEVASNNLTHNIAVYGTNNESIAVANVMNAGTDLSKAGAIEALYDLDQMAIAENVKDTTLLKTTLEISTLATYRYIVIVPDTSMWSPLDVSVYSIDLVGAIVADTNPTAGPASPAPATATPDPTPLPDGYTKYDRTGFVADANSINQNQKPINVLDGDTTTIWHSNGHDLNCDKETNPYTLTIDMGGENLISRYFYIPRPNNGSSGDINGVCTSFDIEISTDGTTWTKVADGNWDFSTDHNERMVTFKEVSARYVRLVIKDSMTNSNGKYYASASEVNIGYYSGDIGKDDMTKALENLKLKIDQVKSLEDGDIKIKLVTALEAIYNSPFATAEGIVEVCDNTNVIIDSLDWSTGLVNENYFNRLFNYLEENNYTVPAFKFASQELDGFNTKGQDVSSDTILDIGLEWCISGEDMELTLIERLSKANNLAKKYINDNPNKNPIMLRELVGYTENCYKDKGELYYNVFGMNASTCEYIVNTIYFALGNLEKIDKGELDTRMETIDSGEVWLDNMGSKISAHGGQVIQFSDGKYYWYGEDNKIGYPLTTGVSCYSSSDMKDWTYEGIAFDVTDTEKNADFAAEFMTDWVQGTQGRIERPKVIYNEKNDNYVMWMHLEKDGVYTCSVSGVAVSDSPTGPFVWKWYGLAVADPYVTYNGKMLTGARDMNLFVDNDKTGYLIYSAEANRVPYLVQLNEDYTWINVEGMNTTDNPVYDENGMYTTAELKSFNSTGTGYVDGGGNDYILTESDMKTLTYVDTTNKNIVVTSTLKNYKLPSFNRYHLASGEGILIRINDVVDREDGLNRIPVNPGKYGRWAKLLQNFNEETGKQEIIQGRESPTIIYTNNRYYLITSGISGWKPNPAMTLTSTEMLGKWISMGSPMTGDGEKMNDENKWTTDANVGTSFNSQSTCMVKIPDGRYMYLGDRWKNASNPDNSGIGVKNSTYVWLPITFDDEDVLKIYYDKSWTWEDQIQFGIETVTVENDIVKSVTLEGEPRESVLYVAVYSLEDCLEDIKIINIDASTNIQIDNIDLQIPSGGLAKAFLWNPNMQPIDMQSIR